MMRSMYSGVAGLKTHQVKMDVIGNNIANVNTTAYKSSSITFSELMSQTTQKASGPNATTGTGGTNAKQIGLGVKSGAINVNITGQGSSQSTGNPFDIMITGENFFVVNNGNENFFTRDGSFYVDGGGNLAMTSTGYNVMGWGVDETTGSIKQDSVAALRIMSAANMTYPPEATSKAYVAGILDKNDKDVTSASGKSINLNFFDALGYSYTAKFTFKQSAAENEYSVELTKLMDADGKEIDISNAVFGEASIQKKEASVVFNKQAYQWDGTTLKTTSGNAVVDVATLYDGANSRMKDLTEDATVNGETKTVKDALDAIAKAYGYEGSTEEFLNLYRNSQENTGTTVTIEDMLMKLASGTVPADTNDAFPTGEESFTMDGREFNGATLVFDSATGKFKGINGVDAIKLGMAKMGGNFADEIEIDFSECSMFDNKGTSTLGATSGDFEGLGAGRRLGDMIGVSIQQNGMIYASYDNGMTRLLGQLATANFANASGL